MNKSINLALIGASGVVGRKILKVLEKRDIQISNFYPLGFSTVGNEIELKNSKYKILDVESFLNVSSCFLFRIKIAFVSTFLCQCFFKGD